MHCAVELNRLVRHLLFPYGGSYMNHGERHINFNELFPLIKAYCDLIDFDSLEQFEVYSSDLCWSLGTVLVYSKEAAMKLARACVLKRPETISLYVCPDRRPAEELPGVVIELHNIFQVPIQPITLADSKKITQDVFRGKTPGFQLLKDYLDATDWNLTNVLLDKYKNFSPEAKELSVAETRRRKALKAIRSNHETA